MGAQNAVIAALTFAEARENKGKSPGKKRERNYKGRGGPREGKLNPIPHCLHGATLNEKREKTGVRNNPQKTELNKRKKEVLGGKRDIFSSLYLFSKGSTFGTKRRSFGAYLPKEERELQRSGD